MSNQVACIDPRRGRKTDLQVALEFQPCTEDDMGNRRHKLAASASDGRCELYKTTAQHEGNEGRAQHSFPAQEELGG